MPVYDFKLTTVSQILENDTILTQALLFTDRNFYGDNLNQTKIFTRNYAKSIIQEIPSKDLCRYQLADVPEISEISVEIEPVKKTPAWIEPVKLKFHVVTWKHADETFVAYVPALDIAVLGEKPENMDERVRSHIKFALYRTKASTSLWKLFQLQRTQDLQIDELFFKPVIPTPKQRKKKKEDRQDQEKGEGTILSEVSIDLTKSVLSHAYEVDEILNRMAEVLTGAKKRSILLVGPSGVGKTAVVHELVRKRGDFKLYNRPFWSTSGSRLIAGMSGFGMWQERCQKLCREAAKTDAIIHVGHLLELMDVGKSLHNSLGIASFLRPYIVRGDVILIAECTPAQLSAIEHDDAHLLGAFHQIEVNEPSWETGKLILLSSAIQQSWKDLRIDEEALDLLDRLHRRYATYSAYPGRPLRFMNNLLKDLPGDGMVTAKDVSAAFSRETGLPLAFIDDSVSLDPEKTAGWFFARVIGQTEAVEMVVDLLCVIKTRLARPGKPLASILFAGPTGVGKTEMAKALAEFLFGNRNRMVRFDMSEFTDPAGAMRLISGSTESQGQLTAKIREQPFAVVLLDEFEKAHPEVFDYFLQVLGEGRLTDVKGRLADFSNAIIIMTSNLGARSFQKGRVGFMEDSDVQEKARQHFMSEVRKFLRREMFNRIDAIVPFAPLDQNTVRQIARRELDLITQRDGIHLRNLETAMDKEVADYLAVKGFDPQYGARPLKRAIERELVVPLAECLNRHSEQDDLIALIDVNKEKLDINVSSDSSLREKKTKTQLSAKRIVVISERCGTLRRNMYRLKTIPEVLDIENEIYRLKRLKYKALRKLKRKGYQNRQDKEQVIRLQALENIIKTLGEVEKKAILIEERFLLSVYAKKPLLEKEVTDALKKIDQDIDDLLLDIYQSKFKKPDYITLAVFGKDPVYLFRLSLAYFNMAKTITGSGIDVIKLLTGHSEKTGKRVIQRKIVQSPDEFLSTPLSRTIGIVLGITGHLVFPKFFSEYGWHTFKEKNKSRKCFVHTSDVEIEKYIPPRQLDIIGGIQSKEQRREYNYLHKEVFDVTLSRKLPWQIGLDKILKMAVSQYLYNEIKLLLGIKAEDVRTPKLK
jgi:ATP-dependent Clp protease ATP-binding subunit ClpC